MPPEQNKIPPATTEVPARNASSIADAGGKPKIVETFATDMAQVLGEDRGGMIKKIIRDEESKDLEKKNLSPESRRNQLFMFAGIALIALALGALLFMQLTRKRVGTVPVETFTPMIFTDKTSFVEIADLNKDQIGKAVLDEAIASDVKYGGVEGLYLTFNKKVLGLRDLVKLLSGSLIVSPTNLVDDNFLLGVYSWETKSPFLLIKMHSVPDIFESMRTWENKMLLDVHGLFGIDISGDNNYLLNKNFEDGVIENKNARILYGEGGNIVLMYVFMDDTHVLIANDPTAAHEVFVRLAGNTIKE